jgi:hypothetical protein
MIQELNAIKDSQLRLDAQVVDEILGKTGQYSRPDPTGPLHDSMTGLWKLMEFLPRRGWKKAPTEGAHGDPSQTPASAGAQPTAPKPALWTHAWMPPHLFKYRTIPSGAWIHPSVRDRIKKCGYAPTLPPDCKDLEFVEGRGFVPNSATK